MALKARFDFQGCLPGGRPAIFTQAADDQLHIGPILQRRRRMPHPETSGVFRQCAPGAAQGFRRNLEFNCVCLIQHEVKMRLPSLPRKRLLNRSNPIPT
jgi:hypothetical protein